MDEYAAPAADSTVAAVIIMLLVLAAAYYTTKLLSRQTAKLTKGRRLEITDRLYVSRDKHIVLLKADNRLFVVGITGQSMHTLGELNAGAEKETEGVPSPDISVPAKAAGGFKDFLKNAGAALERLLPANAAKPGRGGDGQIGPSRREGEPQGEHEDGNE